ncbi:NAD(P)-dependent dehydrogenase (short-subunit alcohol dehydrogenase family) [Salinibacter ruber]|nr:NAD(P)-dependent dehydrogenase (short-subunit alcohol dehydrogenase family) [Salinibacter ruber]
MRDLDSQVVVITGASRGLGAAIARAFGREGARVVVNYYQSPDRAGAVAADIGDRALPVQADVRDPDAVQAMIDTATDHFGAPVTTAVHNALIDYQFDAENRETADTIDWEDYQTQVEGSVKGPCTCSKPAFRRCGRRGRGGLWASAPTLYRPRPSRTTTTPPARRPFSGSRATWRASSGRRASP